MKNEEEKELKGGKKKREKKKDRMKERRKKRRKQRRGRPGSGHTLERMGWGAAPRGRVVGRRPLYSAENGESVWSWCPWGHTRDAIENRFVWPRRYAAKKVSWMILCGVCFSLFSSFLFGRSEVEHYLYYYTEWRMKRKEKRINYGMQ